MFSRKKLTFKHQYEISMISCGDTGEAIGKGIINNLEERGAHVNSLLITSGSIQKSSSKLFSQVISLDQNRDGFSKKLEDSLKLIDKKREMIKEAISKIIPKNKEELLIITTGVGGTGLGGTIAAIDILYKDFKLIPPVFTLLPEVFENSRVQYNAAYFLYHVVFKKENFGNSVILLDNKPSIDELELPFRDISLNRLATIPFAIGDLLFGSFQKSIAEEFDASVSDLFDVIHTPGISVFVVEELQGDSGQDATRLESIIVDSVVKTTSINSDEVFEAKNAYISISNIDPKEEKLSFQTEFEARKLYKEFSQRRPFVKFIKTVEEDDTEFIPMLHAIIAGLGVPPRIIQIMQLGRDTRKDVIYKEYLLNKEEIEFDIDTINEKQNKLHELFNE
ncbi:MAG: hypothetical protein INQ03_05305 [Candidatus Heimdallarchaeota archaeon]|nr:hypothetical protein [Candidatus Heimdallarchaeota archaeon]